MKVTLSLEESDNGASNVPQRRSNTLPLLDLTNPLGLRLPAATKSDSRNGEEDVPLTVCGGELLEVHVMVAVTNGLFTLPSLTVKPTT